MKRPIKTSGLLTLAGLACALAGSFLASPSARAQAAEPRCDLRTLRVSGSETVSLESDLAVLHVGFETAPGKARDAYAEGAATSNAIMAALEGQKVPPADIRSASQFLNRDYSDAKNKTPRYKLSQSWTVRVSPARAAEVLDAAVNAGANNSGEIEWTVKDEKALEQQALGSAARRAREQAEILSAAMGVKLGSLLSVSNELSPGGGPRPMMRMAMAQVGGAAPAPAPLAVSPDKVTRSATVHAVYAIE